jgi:uncharacterized membrane protein
MHRFALPAAEAAAIVLLGLMSGFFFAFAVDVAPAMAQLDGPTYVTTQQWINRVVRSVPFAAAYFGAAVLPFVVAALAFAARRRATGLAWLAIATLYFGAVFWVTRSVNIPINEMMAGWNPAAPPPDWAQLRDRWNDSNLLRTVAAVLCFAAAVALNAATRGCRSR